MRLTFTALLLALASASASAETIAGRASVIDGDTIEIHGERILDIDAPESRQTCQDASGAAWRCGQQAALALSDWIGQQTVTCDTTKLDKYRRHLARCSVGGADLGEWMAGHGWAVPYRECKCETIRDAADFAHQQHAGIWSSVFIMPWVWRKVHRWRESASAPHTPSISRTQYFPSFSHASFSIGRLGAHRAGGHQNWRPTQ
jgi:endonuclease YncB( thermonuclease family)